MELHLRGPTENHEISPRVVRGQPACWVAAIPAEGGMGESLLLPNSDELKKYCCRNNLLGGMISRDSWLRRVPGGAHMELTKEREPPESPSAQTRPPPLSWQNEVMFGKVWIYGFWLCKTFEKDISIIFWSFLLLCLPLTLLPFLVLRQVLRGERKTDRKKEMESLNKTEAHRWGDIEAPTKEGKYIWNRTAGRRNAYQGPEE